MAVHHEPVELPDAVFREYVERRENPLRGSMDGFYPVGESRNAKWWYSAFHNVTAIVGVGVLGLPFAMSNLTWGPGIVVLILSWIITLYTFWQLVEMHEDESGKRFDRYHELGQEAFGETLGLWIVVPQQLIVQVGTNIVYNVTGGVSLHNVHREVCKIQRKDGDCTPHYGIVPFILTFSSVHFVLGQLPNFNAISGVSLGAAIMSVSYSSIAWVASAVHLDARESGVSFKLVPDVARDQTFKAMESLGIVAFAYAGHQVALEIQATIPSTPGKPSKDAMWKGVLLAYAVVAFCYFPVAILGYAAFGNNVEEHILSSLEKPAWLIITANLMVAVHLIGGYQIFAQPVFDNLETILVKRFRLITCFTLRLITRSAYVAFTVFVAVLVPFFGDLLGFVGGFGLAPTTYFLPCIIWLVLKRPKRFSVSWITNWICIVLGVLLMITATMGGFWGLLQKSRRFNLFRY